MNESKFNALSSKRSFVAIFVSTSVFGVLLICIAVYNASTELEVIHQIDSLYQMTADRLNRDAADVHADLGKWARERSTDDYQIFVMNKGRQKDFGIEHQTLAPYINSGTLDRSRINDRGGYVEDQDKIISWADIPFGDLSVVVAHRFQSRGAGELVYVYAKRLLLPAAFYLWMVVWGSLILGFLLDRLRLQKRSMEHMALHDPLTGLPNRLLLADRLTKLMQTAKRDSGSFALAVIDLDKFKDVNDSFGHEAGDSLLRQIAERLSGALRESDTAARLGGDEFTILMPDIDAETCTALCWRIAETLDREYELDGRAIRVGCSIGAALYPDHGRTSDGLMHSADHAMYRAKSEGGGVYVSGATFDVQSLVAVGASTESA